MIQDETQAPDDAFSTVDEKSGRTVTAGQLAAVAQATSTTGFDAASYNTIKSLIQSHLDKLDEASAKQKEFKDMLNDVLLNDPVYQENVKKSDELNKAKTQTKMQLMKDPKVAGVVDKVREFGLQVKETRIALSEYLVQYQQIAGVNEIEDSHGEQREIVLNAKVK